MTRRSLLLFKWLIVFTPPLTVMLGYVLLGHPLGHSLLGFRVGRLVENLVVAFLLLALAYISAEILFGRLQRLQAQASAHEQEVRTMNAVMQERARLSRELHDGAAQLVADLLLRLDTIQELVGADRRQEAEAELERLHGVSNDIYEDIGDAIAGLRTDVVERGLSRALQDYLEQYEERHQISTSLRTDDAADPLSRLAALQVFRLIQEALTNVRKHAAARQAKVALTFHGPDQLSIVIADDGQGFTPDSQMDGKARGLGLTSMRERVENLGGAFRVTSRPGSGTKVTATIPIPDTRRRNEHAARATPAG